MEIRKGDKVFITGAASGIGRATSIAMARLGAKMFLTDINEKGLQETRDIIAKEGGEVAMHEAFDITSYESVKSFADRAIAEFGPPDAIVNNAGIALFALVEDMTHQHWQRVINTNLWGPIHGIECFLPAMIKAKRGHVVNVSSTAGLTGAPWHAAYSTAKWGLVGLSEVLRYDLMQHGIGVTVICPGAVDTPIKEAAEMVNVNRETKRFVKMMDRFNAHSVKPERVAELIIDAVKKEKFLVITSFDIKAVYFLKRKFFPAYHFVMKKISAMMNSMREV